MSITTEQAQRLGSGKVVTTSSAKIGSIGQLYLDDQIGEPARVTVTTGLFGSTHSFVPLQDAQLRGDDVVIGYDEDKVKRAPRVDDDGLDQPGAGRPAVRLLRPVRTRPNLRRRRHGGGLRRDRADWAGGDRTSGSRGDDVPTDADDPSEAGDDGPDLSHQTVGQDRSGPTTDDAMTCSEERLMVGTASREAGHARLRKFVAAENVTQKSGSATRRSPLQREPITAESDDASQSGPAISEEEHEVVLHEEVAVVQKAAVAVERIKLGTETVSEQATVSDDVRKENFELVDPSTDQTPSR